MARSKITIEPFNPQTASDKLWQKYCLFHKKIFSEMYPNDPIEPFKLVREYLLNPDPRFRSFRWLSFSNSGSISGERRVFFENETSPAFNSNKHIAFGFIQILEDF